MSLRRAAVANRALPLAVAAALALVPAARAAQPPERPDPLDVRREAIAKEILRVGVSLRGQIARGDAQAILDRVPAAGLRCGARVIPRARVERDLRTPGSWLHEVFFGEGGSPSAPRSLRAFLGGSGEVAMVVAFRVDPAVGPVGRPCLDFRAKGVATPGAPLCFEQRGGRWWFVESLYPCG
jgi:hypothetical protein